MMKLTKTFLRVLGVALLLFVVSLIAFGAYFFILHNQDLVLPVPTGSHIVGRIEFVWVDKDRNDMLSPNAGEKRELLVWVYYPGTESGQGPTAPYLPLSWIKAHNTAQD